MISITQKSETLRKAIAVGKIKMAPETIQAVRENTVPKGNVIEAARIAGMMAAKKTPDLIPDCHPLTLEKCQLQFEILETEIEIKAEVETISKTGVEMEALTAVSVAALTLYDMLKPLDKKLEISVVKLLEKKGGKSQFKEVLPKNFEAAVVVTSDGTFQGKREDKSGRIIEEKLKSLGISQIKYIILPDEKEQIVKTLLELCDKRIKLIVTTGGTGLGPRDVTVEATSRVVEREMPGAAETMRSYGQRRTPYAMLSRGLVGVRGGTIIVNLPGSSKGAAESMDAIFPALLHTYGMLNGGGH